MIIKEKGVTAALKERLRASFVISPSRLEKSILMFVIKIRAWVVICPLFLFMWSGISGCGTRSQVKVHEEEKEVELEMVEAVRQEAVGVVHSVTLEWDANSEPNIAGYKIHYGTSSRNYDTIIDVGNYTSVTIGSLDGKQNYFFAVTAYDVDGNESGYSDEVFYRPDTDDDGMADAWELLYFGNLDRNGTLDWDNDGLSDLIESEYDTDPKSPDTDGDGFTDAIEVAAATDPNDLQSHPSRAMPWLLPLLFGD